MAPGAANATIRRKRNRKRKRRAASSSSSSSSSSDSSDDEVSVPVVKVALAAPVSQAESSSSESSDESESESSSSDGEVDEPKATASSIVPRGRQGEKAPSQAPRRFSPSPSPPPATLPSFLPSGNAGEPSVVQEQVLKDRFRKFWMAAVADGFRDDLEQIRKEPNLGTSRLGLLIDSLASGADVFALSSDNATVNEMEVVLD